MTGKISIRRKVFLILTVVWMAVIFSFSAKPADESESQSLRAGKIVCSIFVPGYDNMSEQEQIFMAESIDYPVRKAAHATEYAILAGLMLGIVVTSSINWKHLLEVVIVAVVYASTDEFHQLFVPGRSGRFMDVLIDATGALAGVVFIFIVYRLNNKVKIKKSKIK